MGALASALGVAASADDPTERVIAFLRGGQALIVLDCCERVVAGAAVVAESLLERSPDLRILATSREALRAEGEVICRLPALETPPDIDGLTAIEALGFSAIQLFVERVTWTIDDFELSDADAPIVADICRRLDGLPLAIELAAGHVHAFGARGLPRNSWQSVSAADARSSYGYAATSNARRRARLELRDPLGARTGRFAPFVGIRWSLHAGRRLRNRNGRGCLGARGR